jgi:hypothetical protein
MGAREGILMNNERLAMRGILARLISSKNLRGGPRYYWVVDSTRLLKSDIQRLARNSRSLSTITITISSRLLVLKLPKCEESSG